MKGVGAKASAAALHMPLYDVKDSVMRLLLAASLSLLSCLAACSKSTKSSAPEPSPASPPTLTSAAVPTQPASAPSAPEPSPASPSTLTSAAVATPSSAPSGNSDAKPKKQLSGTVTLGDSGVTVTIPEGFVLIEGATENHWEVEGVYEHVGPIPHKGLVAGLMHSPIPVGSRQETIARTCERSPVVASGTLPEGYFFACKRSADFGGTKIETKLVRGRVAAENGRSIECYMEADNPALTKVTEQICRSLKGVSPSRASRRP